MVKMLEDMLHYMIEECEQPQVSLDKEIAVLKDYFELERIRYGNSIDMQVEVSGDTNSKRITPLLMIPSLKTALNTAPARSSGNPG